MELVCYVHEGWAPRIRPAAPKRDWMEETPERFAYRCLPLAIANAHGWEILSPCGFEARWNGGMGVDGVEIRLDPGTQTHHAPVSLFGQGTITFHIEGIIRTPKGWNLWVGGSPNAAKDGIAPLGGVIETDWSPYTFTMNWRFTRPDQWVRFEKDEPFCFFFPVQRGVLEEMAPEIRPLEDAPEIMAAFKAWSASRNAFQAHMQAHPPKAPADKWQKLYFRGLDPDGEPGAPDHQSKVRVEPFKGCPVTGAGAPAPQAAPQHAAPKPAAAPAFNAILAAPGGRASAFAPKAFPQYDKSITLDRAGLRFKVSPPKPAAPAKAAPAAAPVQSRPDLSLARRDWIMGAAERQRALSPRMGRVRRVRGLSSEDFLDHFYAASRPVVIEGEIDDWPALKLWTPDHLRAAVGAAEVEYQAGRDRRPDFELYKDNHKRRGPFDRFIDQITAGGEGNDLYLTAYNSGANRAALSPLDKDLGPISKFLTPAQGMIWIGPGGTFTPLHFDLTNNLLAQVTGRKRIVLVPPSETSKLANTRHVFSEVHDIEDRGQLERHPLAKDAVRFEVELGPGELLYIPLGWWHQVRSREFSVTLTYTNFLWRNDAFEAFPGD